MFGHQRFRRPVVVAMAAVGLVVMATPAPAATGSGGGSGAYSYVNQPAGGTQPICTKITGTYTGTWTGTYIHQGLNPGMTKTYDGSLTASHVYTVFASPLGTFSDNNCLIPGPGTITSASTVSPSPANGISLSCSWTSGTFTRSGATWVVNLDPATGSGTNCTLTQGSNTYSSKTSETRTGTLTNCMPTTGPPTSCDSIGDTYAATD